MRVKKWLLVTVFLVSQAVAAEDLLQVYELARAHDARYQAALLKFKGDVLTLDISRSRYRPQLGLTYRIARNDYESDQLDASQLDVSGCADLTCIVDRVNRLQDEGTRSTYTSQQGSALLTQTVYDASLLADNKKAEAFSEKARQEMLDAEMELVMRVTAAYLQALHAAEAKRLLAQQIEKTGTLGKLAENRFSLGVGKVQERAEAEALGDQQALALLAAESEYALSMQQLHQLAGQPLQNVVPLADSLPVAVVKEQPLQAWQQQARVSNHGLQAARAFEQVSYFDWQAKKRAWWPKFNVAASYIDENYSGGRGFSPEATTMAYGLEMKWPLYQGGGITAASKQSAYRLQESQQRVREMQEQLDQAVLGLVLAIEADIERYAAARRLLESSERLVQVGSKAYHNGSGTLLQWFDAERKLAEARQQLAQVRYDHIEHRLSLLRLTGELSVKELQQLNSWLAH